MHMKKLFSLVILSFLFFSFASATTTYISKTENGHAYRVMKVSLDGKSKIVVAAVNNLMPAQSLKTLMINMWWTHAINGGFFCPDEAAYWACRGTTDGLRISNGTLYSKRGKDVWEYKSVFGFDSEGNVMPMGQRDRDHRANGTWQNASVDKIYNGMMMPTLVQDGIDVAPLNDEMNNDWRQSAAKEKTFICSTNDNSIVYMWYVSAISFLNLSSYIIETFGCYNAILLDNWWTKAMINNGSYVAGPWRAMMDAFVVIEGNNVWAQIAPINMDNETSTSSEELQTAVAWMYSKWLTSKSTVADYLPNNTMTREEASKFFSVFAKTIYNKSEGSATSCSFSDIKRADSTLRDSITSACRLGIFQWYKNTFTPLDKLTKAQAITVLMRVMVGKLVEPSKAFYTNYYLKAKEFKLTENINVNANITRWEAAILLYKANIYKEESNDETTVSDTEDIVDILPNTITDIIIPDNNFTEQTNIINNNIMEEEMSDENILHTFEIYKDYEKNHLTLLNEYRKNKWAKELILSEELSTCAKNYAKDLLKLWWYAITHNLNWTTPMSRCGDIFNSSIVEENLLLIWHGMVDGDEALDWWSEKLSCETRQINNDFWSIGIASVWDHTIQKGIRIQVLVP